MLRVTAGMDSAFPRALQEKRGGAALSESGVTAAGGPGGIWQKRSGAPAGGRPWRWDLPWAPRPTAPRPAPPRPAPPAFRNGLDCPLVATGCDLRASPSPNCSGSVCTTSLAGPHFPSAFHPLPYSRERQLHFQTLGVDSELVWALWGSESPSCLVQDQSLQLPLAPPPRCVPSSCP